MRKLKETLKFEKPTAASARRYIKETDKWLLLFTLAASIYGVLLVFSATYNNRGDSPIPRDALVMFIALVIGMVGCMILSSLDYELIGRLWIIIGIGCVLLMLITLIFGKPLNPDRPDAKSWLTLGPINFQPSELVKVGFIVTFAVHLDTVRDEINKIKNVALLCVHALVPVGLVMLTGDDGSALVFIIIFIGMLFAAGLHWAYFLLGISAIVIGLPILWYTGIIIDDHQKERILAIIDPDKYAQTTAYQQNQGITAIGSGQTTGKGILQGNYTQNDIVPESQNDMIFTVAGEELGYIGAIAVVAILFLIILRIILNGKRSKDTLGYLMCIGTAVMLAGQSILNIGMCLRVLPVIGITLPFFSAGGSSNMCVYFALGLAMSVYRYNQARPPVDFRVSRIATAYSGR